MKLLKKLQETKNAKIEAMEEMLTREAENFKVEEIENLKREIEEINTKIEAIKGADEMVRSVEVDKEKVIKNVEDKEQTRAMEQEDLFLRAIQGESKAMEELRAITGGDALIPTTIAKDIIKQVEVLSHAYAKAKKFPIAGKLTFVLEDTETSEITVGYVEDEAETKESKPSFKQQAIDDFQIRGLVKISRSLLGKSQFNLREYVVDKIAKAYAKFVDKEFFNGTAEAAKIKGLVTLPEARKVEVQSSTEINADDLVKLECLVPSALRGACEFYMNPKMVEKLRMLKYETGEKVLQRDLQQTFKYNLLGYRINESDEIKENHIFFADMSGYYCKEVTNLAIQVLKEKYATFNMTGYHAVAELGGAPVEIQKLAMLEKKTA